MHRLVSDVGEGLRGGKRGDLRCHPRLDRARDGQRRVDRVDCRVDLKDIVVVVAGADAVGLVVAGRAVEAAEVLEAAARGRRSPCCHACVPLAVGGGVPAAARKVVCYGQEIERQVDALPIDDDVFGLAIRVGVAPAEQRRASRGAQALDVVRLEPYPRPGELVDGGRRRRRSLLTMYISFL
jgi:hypothetical protein